MYEGHEFPNANLGRGLKARYRSISEKNDHYSSFHLMCERSQRYKREHAACNSACSARAHVRARNAQIVGFALLALTLFAHNVKRSIGAKCCKILFLASGVQNVEN